MPTIRRAAAAAAVFALAACDRAPKPRRYSEIVFRPKASAFQGAEAPIHISWSLPEGWVEQPGGDPMRVASFLAPDPALANTGEMDPEAVDVSITQLAGDGGGLPANLKRWLGQVKIPATDSQVRSIISRADTIRAATGQKGILVDFTDLLSGDMTQTTSMVGAVLSGNGYTVFVKAKGDRRRLVKLKAQISGFCRALTIVEEKK